MWSKCLIWSRIKNKVSSLNVLFKNIKLLQMDTPSKLLPRILSFLKANELSKPDSICEKFHFISLPENTSFEDHLPAVFSCLHGSP